jgi:integrase
MAEIKTPHIGKVMKRAHDMGRGAQTRKHIYSLVRRMFGDAIEVYDMLKENPVRPKHHRPKVGERERNYLRPHETLALLEACRGHFLGRAIWIQSLSGLRPSEVQALTWGSIDSDGKVILIRAAYNKKTRTMQSFPKQVDWGRAPLPDELLEYLRPHFGAMDELVAPGPSGGVLSYETYLPGLKRLCRQAKVSEVTPHELRHSAAFLYGEAGASTEDIRKLLNHKSLNATKHYLHRGDERLGRIAGGLSNTLRIIPGGKISNA